MLHLRGRYSLLKFAQILSVCRDFLQGSEYKSRSHPTKEIFYIQTLGGSPYKLTKFERISGGGTSPLTDLKKEGFKIKLYI
jgi:hypothetical protein